MGPIPAYRTHRKMHTICHGQRIAFPYPMHTHVTHVRRSNCTLRNVHVIGVRDLVTDPLTAAEFLSDPYVNRSRYLIRGWCERARDHRQFYLGTSPEFRSPGALRLAFRDPETDSIRIVSRQFEPTALDRRVLVRLFRGASAKEPAMAECLRITADDLSFRS